MGWAYFLDLELRVPAAAWPALEAATPSRQGIALGWWGFADAALEQPFVADDCNDMTAASALAAFLYVQGVCKIDRGGEVTVRMCTLLDERSESYLVKPLAALIDAARGVGTGRIALVNDGTHPGEGGVSVMVTGATVTRERIADPAPLAERLATQVFGAFVDDTDDEPPKPKKPRKAKAKS